MEGIRLNGVMESGGEKKILGLRLVTEEADFALCYRPRAEVSTRRSEA